MQEITSEQYLKGIYEATRKINNIAEFHEQTRIGFERILKDLNELKELKLKAESSK